MFPERPEIIAEKQGEFDIEYIGPLAKAQRAQTGLAMKSWADSIIEVATQLANINPEAALEITGVVNWSEWSAELADILGVPASVMIDRKILASDKRKRKAETSKQTQAADAAAAGGVMKEVGEGAQAMQEAGLTPPEEEQIAA